MPHASWAGQGKRVDSEPICTVCKKQYKGMHHNAADKRWVARKQTYLILSAALSDLKRRDTHQSSSVKCMRTKKQTLSKWNRFGYGYITTQNPSIQYLFSLSWTGRRGEACASLQRSLGERQRAHAGQVASRTIHKNISITRLIQSTVICHWNKYSFLIKGKNRVVLKKIIKSESILR